MALVIVNPSPKPRARKARSKSATPAQTKATSKGVAAMAKRRSPAQQRAFKRMISANPHRKRRRVHNPAPRRAVSRRRHHNPSPVHHRRRYRNPSGGPDMLKELMSTDGLIAVASIAAWPTVGGLVMTQFFPTMSGYTKYATQAGIGIALGYLLHKFVHKEAGKMVALVSAGNGIAQMIQVYQGTLQGYERLGGRVLPNGMVQMAGYAPMGRNDGNLNGLAKEPGMVYV